MTPLTSQTTADAHAVFAGIASLLQSASALVALTGPILSTEPWLSLLLRLSSRGPNEVQRRAHRVLQRVLPTVKPSAVQVSRCGASMFFASQLVTL